MPWTSEQYLKLWRILAEKNQPGNELPPYAMERRAAALVKKFFLHVRKTESCWLWEGHINPGTGYGRVGIFYKSWMAHRLSYAIHHLKHPGELSVCHSCDNPPCVNPEHLWLGSTLDNVQDAIRKGRRPIRKGEELRQSKLTEVTVKEIRARYSETKSKHHWGAVALAKKYGVSITTITRAATGEQWRF